MASMSDIKRRIKSVSSTEHITSAMKLVSAGKLRKSKELFEHTNENSHYITKVISELFNSSREIPASYLSSKREVKNTCYIVVTSCRGLCGGFNSNVLKEVQMMVDENRSNSLFVAIGTKGRDYLNKRRYDVFSEYLSPPESLSHLETMELIKPIIEMYNAGKIDEIVLVSTVFVNSMEQQVAVQRLLPFDDEDTKQADKKTKIVEYGPSIEEVLEYIILKYLEMKLYAAVVESATCEHAARRMAMENATDSARDMLAMLSTTYNRARQSSITDEIIEIVAGTEAQG